jgi:heavy metal translocating P-type ATPase
VDGTVVEGHGRIDESYLTGEPFEISKAPGSSVLSGAVNKDQLLVIEASKLPEDSRHAQIVRLLEQTESNRPHLRRLGDKLAAWYTPIAVGAALGAWFWTGDPLRFLAVTVIATPCPLLIAIPVAILGAISLAAKRGVIIKNPAALEQIENCRTLIFDKTGTLTYGKPVLTEVLCAEGFSRSEVLGKTASLEQYSKHPLAAAILKAAREAGVGTARVESIIEKPGAGLQGTVDGMHIRITARSQVPDIALPQATTGLECVVLFDGRLAAVLRFRDTPREESRPFIAHLRPSHGARRIVLLSGDREEEVRYLADQVGIAELHFSKSPEEKVAFVAAATEQQNTLFVGDGINDAPAMLAATVGVALGSNSDITSEAADAVVLDSSLERTDELIHISRRMRRIALQSAVGGMALSMIGMVFAATGQLSPVTGAVAQEAIDLAAVLNALRVASYHRRLADF